MNWQPVVRDFTVKATGICFIVQHIKKLKNYKTLFPSTLHIFMSFIAKRTCQKTENKSGNSKHKTQKSKMEVTSCKQRTQNIPTQKPVCDIMFCVRVF